MSNKQTSWQRLPIKEIYKNFYDGPHATPKHPNEGPIFLGIKNITEDGRLDLSEVKHISEGDFSKWTRRVLPQAGDIVFTYEATLHRYAIVPQTFRGCLGRRIALIRPDVEKVNSKFLLYYFLGNEWRSLINERVFVGATVDRIPLIEFPNFEVRIPSVFAQKKIAAILSTYDDLIENNDRRIALLEKMAEEIYREWFVRLRFPGHEQVSFHKGIPANWEEKSLSDICVLQSGYAFKSSDFTDNEGGRIVVRMGNFKINHGLQFDNNTKYLASNVQVSEKFKLKPGDLLIVLSDVTRGGSIIGNIGIVPSSDKEFVLNQRASKIKVQKEYFFYLYGILSSISFKNHCLSRADSATVLNLSNKDFYEYKLLLPPDDLIGSFSDFYRPYRLAVMNLSIANQKLKQTRDRLLTRLISGKLSVTDLNIQFPPGMVEP